MTDPTRRSVPKPGKLIEIEFLCNKLSKSASALQNSCGADRDNLEASLLLLLRRLEELFEPHRMHFSSAILDQIRKAKVEARLMTQEEADKLKAKWASKELPATDPDRTWFPQQGLDYRSGTHEPEPQTADEVETLCDRLATLTRAMRKSSERDKLFPLEVSENIQHVLDVQSVVGRLAVLFKEDSSRFSPKNLMQIRYTKIKAGLMTEEEARLVEVKYETRLAHQKQLKAANRENKGIRKATRKHRENHCFGCKNRVETGINLECVTCGWLICQCGACGCIYERNGPSYGPHVDYDYSDCEAACEQEEDESEHEVLVGMGLDPDDPDYNDLAPHGMEADYDEDDKAEEEDTRPLPDYLRLDLDHSEYDDLDLDDDIGPDDDGEEVDW